MFQGPQSIRRPMAAAALLCVLAAVGACSTPPSNGGGPGGGTLVPESPVPVGDDTVRINEMQALGTHNSYHLAPESALLNWLRVGSSAFPAIATALGNPEDLNYTHAPLPTQLARGLRTFELDVAADPQGGLYAAPLLPQLLNLGYPALGADMTAPGMKVVHIQDIDYLSTCQPLLDCLAELRTFSDAQPDHLPIVVNIEAKEELLPEPFNSTVPVPFTAEQFDALDAEIRSVLGDRLITPDDVRGDQPDLRTAVTTVGWPTVAESRGKFLFFLDNGDRRTTYLQDHPGLQGRVMFTSSGFGQPDGALLKVNGPGDGSFIRSLVEQGFMVRTRADDTPSNPSAAQRDIALASGAQVVHTDFPRGEFQTQGGYGVEFPTRVQARCNPVVPGTCQPAALVERSYLTP
ncbi:MAG: Ca2+-dependent phosphoinositide-specific phospholipase C [Actinomycetes bacterium]